MLVHYVEFLYPGIMVTETSQRRIRNRNTKIRASKDCFGYSFFDREEIVNKDGEVLKGESKNHSGTYYFGKVMTLEDVKNQMPAAKTLISNMVGEGYEEVVKTRIGNFQYFKPGDMVVAEK